MEKILATKDAELKLMVDTFKKKDVIFRSGKPTYRVYKNNQFIFQSTDLWTAYLKFLLPDSTDMDSFFQTKMDKTLLILNTKRGEKVYGIFNNLSYCAHEVYRFIHLFIKKSTDKDVARLNWLNYVFRNKEGFEIDKSLIPYLEIRNINMNFMTLRDF